MLSEEIANGIGPVLGQGHVVLVRSDAVGVAFHFELQAGMRQDDTRELGQFFTSHGPESELPCVEEDIGHVDDEASGTVAGFQNLIELLRQFVTQFLFLPLGLLQGRPARLLAGRQRRFFIKRGALSRNLCFQLGAFGLCSSRRGVRFGACSSPRGLVRLGVGAVSRSVGLCFAFG